MDTTVPADFKDFLRLLNGNGVEYLLIGGYAVAYYGYLPWPAQAKAKRGRSYRNAPRCVRNDYAQANPTMLPSASMSILSDAGFFGRPGIVIISPESTTMNPAPAFR